MAGGDQVKPITVELVTAGSLASESGIPGTVMAGGLSGVSELVLPSVSVSVGGGSAGNLPAIACSKTICALYSNIRVTILILFNIYYFIQEIAILLTILVVYNEIKVLIDISILLDGLANLVIYLFLSFDLKRLPDEVGSLTATLIFRRPTW